MAPNVRADSAKPGVTLDLGVRLGPVTPVWPLRGLSNAARTTADTRDLRQNVRPSEGLALRWLGHEWNGLAKRDALGSVLTRPATDPQWNTEDFFATGQADVAKLMTAAARVAPTLATRRALDFGCGVGRLTRALADYFDEVQGIDIAPSMIARARQQNGIPEGCHFEVNRRPHLQRFDDGLFDLVYSRLVLQHIPPRLVKRYIPELVRVLAPGGLLVFQLPTEIDDSRRAFLEAPVQGGPLKHALPPELVHAYRQVKYVALRTVMPHMDMFGMARSVVVEMVEGSGARLLAIEPDNAHGTRTPGFEYWATKPQPTDRLGPRRPGVLMQGPAR